MDPRRITMTHSLITGLGIYQSLDVYSSRAASEAEICSFHSADYVEYLKNYVSANELKKLKENEIDLYRSQKNNKRKRELYGIEVQTDCPGFDGLFAFSQLSTGGSLDAAELLITGRADIAIN